MDDGDDGDDGDDTDGRARNDVNDGKNTRELVDELDGSARGRRRATVELDITREPDSRCIHGDEG